MSATTPGPWAIDPERPTMANGVVLGYYIRDPKSGGRIGQVFENCLVTTQGEALANAQAFAAAPAMRDALERLSQKADYLASLNRGGCAIAWEEWAALEDGIRGAIECLAKGTAQP